MQTGSYVNGKWHTPASSRISRNINPADTSDVIAEYPLATAADVRLAIDAAMQAFVSWKKTPGPERGRVLWRAADEKGFPAYWLVRLRAGEYGLLAKLGGRWGWHAGDRNTMFATVPDTLLDAATEIAIARDV